MKIFKINRKGHSLFSIIVISALILLSPSASNNKGIPLKSYLHYKSLCNYERAMDILEEWTIGLDDPVEIEINIFRINELIKHLELIEKGYNIFNNILNKNEIVKQNKFLSARIRTFLIGLHLKKGDIRKAKEERDDLGFLADYKIIGPFSNRGTNEFENKYPPESGFNKNASYKGKTASVKWFDTSAGPNGSINIRDLFQETRDTLFYLRSVITVPEDGNYILSLGKTGCIDIWIDGERLFSNRKRHSYLPDQYFISLFLSGGRHDIQVKIGESPEAGIKLGLRITDEKGGTVKKDSGDPGTSKSTSRLLKSGYFPSLETAVKNAADSEYNKFTAGYLIFISRLSSIEGREAFKFLNQADSSGELSVSSYFYLGHLESNHEQRDFYYYKSLRGNSRNIEALNEIAKIKIKNKFIYEASPVIESIKEVDPLSVVYLKLKARLVLSRGWHEEAMKIAEKLKETRYPSIGYSLETRINKYNKKYNEALAGYRYLYKYNKSSLNLINKISECQLALGNFDDIKRLYGNAIMMFPNNVHLRLKFAEIIGNYDNINKILPYLTSALKLSPYNRQTLLDVGIFYHKIGKRDLAIYYLRRALLYNPNNFELKRFLGIITEEKNEIEDYLVKDDPIGLAATAGEYRNEPAIILLSESAYRVLPNGSYEKRVRKVYKINDQNAVKEFTTQYVVINPDTDRVEDIKCVVINGGERIQTSEVSKRSLSNPESRLYYDLQAHMITVPSLRKGSILDFSYIVKSRTGEIFKNYFGEKILIGDEYRTIISNILISYPENKHIYIHLKDIEKKHTQTLTSSDKRIHRVYLKNIPPYKVESAMPNDSEILPCVYFCSHRDWDEVFKWYTGLYRDRIKLSEEMKSLVSEIIGPHDTDLEKVRKIYNHVNQAIRYVGFEFGVGGIQPRSSDLTYHTKMGDCKDITLVLIALLKEAGIDARMALLRVRDSGKANLAVPMLGEFNHAICYVNLEGGFFIDGTAKMSGFRELPRQDRGVTTLVLADRGYKFIPTDSKIYFKNLETAETDIKIDKSGSALLSRTIKREGSFCADLRYTVLNREGWANQIKAFWNKKYPGSNIYDLKAGDIEIDGPVSYSYSIKIPSLVNIEGEEMIFSPFLMTSNYYRNFAMLRERKFSIQFSKKRTAVVKIKYRIPQGYSIYRIPESEEYTHERFKASFNYKKNAEGQEIEVESIIGFLDYQVDVEEYKSFRDFTLFIERKENEKIVLVGESGD